MVQRDAKRASGSSKTIRRTPACLVLDWPSLRIRPADLTGAQFFFASFCAIRAFTNFFTNATGSGLSNGKRMVPLDVE